MRLLLNLITALSDDEAAKIAALQLRGRQRAVMDLVFSKRSTGIHPSEEEIARLNLSSTHLYEISSVVLGKCHHVLVPEGGIALLEFFTYKNLILQFKQELRKQRKKLPNKKGKEAEVFFLSCFELLHRFTYNLIDHDLIEQYGKLYLASKKESSQNDVLAIEARMLQAKLSQIISEGKNFQNEQKRVSEKLTEMEAAAIKSSHPYLCHNVYSTLAWYWQHLAAKPEKMLHYLELAIPYSIKLDGYVFRDTSLEMQLKVADAHFLLGSTHEALEIFDKIYSTLRPDHVLWKRYYFLFRYLEVLIYNNKFTKAEKILHDRFEQYFKMEPTTASATASTLFAIIYLLSGDYMKAKQYLDIGIELNTKTNFTLYNEVRNRYIEAAYYYLTGDWDYALEVTNRAMQYIRSKHLGLNKHIFGYYFKIIDASIKFYSQGTPLWHKYEEKYKELTEPSEGLFGKLLQKIRTTPKRRK